MENLEKLIYDLYKKNARQCTNEEIYNALLLSLIHIFVGISYDKKQKTHNCVIEKYSEK